MASAKITLIGMYNFDDTLFNDLTLPTGINKDDFVASLLTDAGEFEVLYPDMDFLKQSIKLWGMKWNHTFERWLTGINADWNPIENYDRQESSIDLLEHTQNLQDKRTADLNEQTTNNTSDTQSTTVNASVEKQKSAYDSSTYTPVEKEITNGGTQQLAKTGTVDIDTTGTDTIDHTGTSKDKRTITGRVHGNIGVTQASEMLKNYYDIARWNLINNMVDVFKSELLICVY